MRPRSIASVALAFVAAVLACGGVARGARGQGNPAAGMSCIVCHGKEGKGFLEGVHAPVGVLCTDCHGGDPTRTSREACVESAGFRGVPRGSQITELCGGCHSDIDRMRQYGLPTDQLELYKTSPHGQRLYREDNSDVPTCVDCHGVHGIRSVVDPSSPVYRANVPRTCARCHSDPEMMERYGHPSSVFDDYASSVHGKGLLEEGELGLPHCGDCHSSHGAKPAGVREVANVCGHCHTATRDSFRKSPHFAAGEQGIMEECTTCHGHHAVKSASVLVEGDGRKRLCAQCHDPDSSEDRGWATAVETARILDGLRAGIEAAAARIRDARGRGLHTEEEKGYLNEARHVLIMTGPVSHEASIASLREVAGKGEGILRRIDESVDLKLRRVRDRRLVSTIVFGVLLLIVLLLYVKMRTTLSASRRPSGIPGASDPVRSTDGS